jgi:predicted  nucleic acid-binding Zn-ribbon protein
MDLQGRVDQVISENRSLQEAKQRAEQALQEATHLRDGHANTIQQATDAVASRDLAIQEKDMQIAQLSSALAQVQQDISRITEANEHLSSQHHELSSNANSRVVSLETENTHAHAQWQATFRELEELKSKHQTLNQGMAEIVRDEIAAATVDKDAEIERLQQELTNKVEEIKALQAQLLNASQTETFLNVRNEDYFDSACQQLCQHVQQWVLRFSKFSDNKMCRFSSDINDEKLRDRLDDAILDGSDVDVLLGDRIKRRDVFMSVVMSMVWEYVFTRYLFGMDRDQRKKLKTLEETLSQVGMLHRTREMWYRY